MGDKERERDRVRAANFHRQTDSISIYDDVIKPRRDAISLPISQNIRLSHIVGRGMV